VKIIITPHIKDDQLWQPLAHTTSIAYRKPTGESFSSCARVSLRWNLPDITTREDITIFVDGFHRKVRQDDGACLFLPNTKGRMAAPPQPNV